ncbi:MAG: FAD-dependent oxidoreductase [Kiritimatiellae bacterium]|nr:FAD-dependent oxidoreductase [Kiritimatiellia bacterium]
MKKLFHLCAALLLAAVSMAEDPAETLRKFRAPAKECREAVKGFLWLEAEEFPDYGGWEIDTQFVHKMGSAYLITKGVLKPLAPAKTEVEVPSPGTWRAWVRTKDWLPEFSPGKFALEVGGRRSCDLGVSKKEGWRWEKAGDFSLAAGRTEVALVDLAGGFARCDAVLLTTDLSYVPPDGGERLETARRRLSGADPAIADGGEYDVVVVGAGPGGLGASIAAARHGMKTLLVHDRPVLGGNNSIEQHTSIGGSGNNFKDGVADSREGGILEEARLLRRSRKCSESATYRIMVDAEPLITERPNERVLAAEKRGDRIVSVTANSTLTGGRVRYRGKVFIDGTGDGGLGYFVGASRMFGREAKSEFGEKDAPDKADELTMSGCIDDYVYHDTGKEEPFEVPAWARILPEGFNRPDVNGIQARWWLEHPGTFDDLEDPERARDELIRIHLDYWGWLRKHPTFGVKARTSRLDEIKIHNGRREGWRLVGDYVLTSTDCREGRRFPDAITCGGWALDLHDPMGVMNPKGNGWWSVDQTRIYTIPYRCIYSKDVANLYMAGRNISVTHAALGSTRIMGTIFTIGQATGTAAAIAVREGMSVRDVGARRIKALQQALLKDDQFIPGVKNEDPLDLARSAKVRASSTMQRVTYDENDLDFLGVNCCWAFVESLWLELAACFPRGGADRLDEVFCYMRNRTGSAQNLVMDVFESNEIAKDGSTRKPLGTMTATAEPEGGGTQFVRFSAPAPLRPTKKYVWLKVRICKGVDWFRRIHVYPDGGCMAYVRDGGVFDIRDFYQLAFYTKPLRTGSVDSRPEYVVDGFSRPDIYPADGHCTHAWRSDPAKPFPQAVRLDFPKPVSAGEVRIVFDSGLTFGGIMWPTPKMLVKDYSLWGLADGKWRKLAEVKDNMKRLQVHRFDDVKVSAVNVKVDATWGAPSAHIQEIRVYAGR